MLGKDIVNSLLKKSNIEIHGIDLNSSIIENKNFHQHIFNITELSRLNEVLRDIQPEIIVHTAAIVSLMECEDNYKLVNKLHVDVTRELSKIKAKVIYISTDSVFNGIKGDYLETEIPDPLNNYAKTKYLGEIAVQANCNDYIIIRTNIFGFSIPLKGSIVEWAIKSFQNREEIDGFIDVFFNPIYTKHLAKRIIDLIQLDYKGVINLASLNKVSKYDFLTCIATYAGFSKAIIHESSIAGINSSIPRPKNTTLNINHANKILELPTISEGIEDLIKDLKKEANYERD
jgi:dTDP-4-dehydrorhamnose reductase